VGLYGERQRAAILDSKRFGRGGQQVSFEPSGGGTWTGPDDHSVSLRIGYQFVLAANSESLFRHHGH
jgi:hypothetical protein